MNPINTTLIGIKDETPNVRSFAFDVSFNYIPGQFVMVWVRGVDEIPMSLSCSNMITVQRVGEATEALFELEVGDTIGIRGPYGNGFEIHNPVLIVAGGVGAAPLAPLAEEANRLGHDVVTLLAARTKDDLLFLDRFKWAGRVYTATDDGSYGHHGLITDILNISSYKNIYMCGPEPMMGAVMDKLTHFELTRTWVSLHRYIKCGLGVCGACCIDPCGHGMCKDGPVMRASDLVGSEFGRYKRGADGGRKYEVI